MSEVEKELMPIIASLGFLSVYAVEMEVPREHPVYSLIDNLTRIIKLYKSKYKDLLAKSFDVFDEIVDTREIQVDVIAFANALLVLHRYKRKHFNPNQKAVTNFWIEYKKNKMGKDDITTYRMSRYLASEFFKRVGL